MLVTQGNKRKSAIYWGGNVFACVSLLSPCHAGVNIPRSQNLYRELVSISVPEDQLISQALHDRLKLVPSAPSNKV